MRNNEILESATKTSVWNERKKSARKIKSKKSKEFFLRFAYGRNNKLRINVRICTKEYAYMGKTVGSDIEMI